MIYQMMLSNRLLTSHLLSVDSTDKVIMLNVSKRIPVKVLANTALSVYGQIIRKQVNRLSLL